MMLGVVTVNDIAGAADRLLAGTADTLAAQGLKLAGAVQDNLDRGPGHDCDMDLRILGDSGPAIRISQSLGPHATACRLDSGALQQAVARAEAVLERGADLVIVNKFGKQESYGRGFRDFIAEALARDIPVLLSVPVDQLPGFHEFAGDLAEALRPETVLDWCRAKTRRAA
jgi:NAD(P)-dependent dehydrogenase (short-subunit alcohol dehydrogenase family)